LSSQETLEVLNALKSSSLFREDQSSYLLYPNKDLKGFLDKNTIPKKAVSSSKLMQQMIKDQFVGIVEKDVNGVCHFNGTFKNAGEVADALKKLSDTKYREFLLSDTPKVLQAFEDVFNHKAFTGRSGRFYGYEGLGSIYWHMVSKLLLAVQESCARAVEDDQDPALIACLSEHFYEIYEGIGIHKSPELYGAFPIDPYSHTPAGRGAQQPGMTGQVKEDVLSRFGELGLQVRKGRLMFQPCLLRKNEFVSKQTPFNYVNLFGEEKVITLPKDSLGFTYCQIPIVYHISKREGLKMVFKDGSHRLENALAIDSTISQAIFQRTGDIVRIEAFIHHHQLK